ncbi:hypothetical protein llap_20194 [Limosa lapponica baueri]|uniref:Uncharacterized protein n=1 Tax=Limosa lapponica baueri TaxID=1758121 RepID=A0A2I0T6U9_LIMLA|nr:hypothetical protein llap_20194 [Limosa lapponica baueri]
MGSNVNPVQLGTRAARHGAMCHQFYSRISSRRARALMFVQESSKLLCSPYGQSMTPPCQLGTSRREKTRTGEKPSSMPQRDGAIINICPQCHSPNPSKTLLLLAKLHANAECP